MSETQWIKCSEQMPPKDHTLIVIKVKGKVLGKIVSLDFHRCNNYAAEDTEWSLTPADK